MLSYKTLWNKLKKEIKESTNERMFNTWIEPIKPIALNRNNLILELPNQFFYEWIETHYKNQFEKIIKEKTKEEINIQFTIGVENVSNKVEKRTEHKKEAPAQKNTNLNKKYVFSNFIEGGCNQFAKAASTSVSEFPGQKGFNPLVIYGGVGLGKTHLLNAIGNQINENHPKLNTVGATSERFTIDFISSIQKNNTITFSQFYRKADVLLIDDIQFLQGKEQTQEQFFHTFNELYQNGKQVVLTADKYPTEMKGLKERLLSRFESGLAVDVQPPDFETRVAILMEKAEQSGLALSYDVIELIATHIKDNVRELESTVIRLLARSSLAKTDINLDLAKNVIIERKGRSLATELTIQEVVKRVSNFTKVPEEKIVGKGRERKIAEARQLSAYLCRDILGSTLVNIGMFLGGRDHTTIMYAYKNIEKRIEKEPRIRKTVDTLKKEFNYALS
ncbi:MAG: chromosomal replication initiator protein DnaA [Candidatus Marinimicrobia bacterium]|jgi:chromosomal replication initiator protein|nr:chromosomal replication initiator protein DnaA [Candidatus Neomarinimicrobiota bacterium]|tara:strand:+ start:2182 stop:3525 length:1344 start_codon:yes stop_codon:yes gene_type:complete